MGKMIFCIFLCVFIMGCRDEPGHSPIQKSKDMAVDVAPDISKEDMATPKTRLVTFSGVVLDAMTTGVVEELTAQILPGKQVSLDSGERVEVDQIVKLGPAGSTFDVPIWITVPLNTAQVEGVEFPLYSRQSTDEPFKRHVLNDGTSSFAQVIDQGTRIRFPVQHFSEVVWLDPVKSLASFCNGKTPPSVTQGCPPGGLLHPANNKTPRTDYTFCEHGVRDGIDFSIGGIDAKAPFDCTVTQASNTCAVTCQYVDATKSCPNCACNPYGRYFFCKSGQWTVLMAHFEELDSKVKVGASLKRGQIVGKIGNTGCSTGAHLHFGLFKDRDKPGGTDGGVSHDPTQCLVPDEGDTQEEVDSNNDSISKLWDAIAIIWPTESGEDQTHGFATRPKVTAFVTSRIEYPQSVGVVLQAGSRAIRADFPKSMVNLALFQQGDVVSFDVKSIKTFAQSYVFISDAAAVKRLGKGARIGTLDGNTLTFERKHVHMWMTYSGKTTNSGTGCGSVWKCYETSKPSLILRTRRTLSSGAAFRFDGPLYSFPGFLADGPLNYQLNVADEAWLP